MLNLDSEVRGELDGIGVDVKDVLGERAPELAIGGSDELIGIGKSYSIVRQIFMNHLRLRFKIKKYAQNGLKQKITIYNKEKCYQIYIKSYKNN